MIRRMIGVSTPQARESSSKKIDYVKQIKNAVLTYINSSVKEEDSAKILRQITEDDLNLVWFAKTLQNWKALVSIPWAGEYYELTYNGDKYELYIDEYMKKNNAILFPATHSSTKS
jgi:hypothetical protein